MDYTSVIFSHPVFYLFDFLVQQFLIYLAFWIRPYVPALYSKATTALQLVQGLFYFQGEWQAAWLCRAVTCIDLTTLSGDDTESNVDRLCLKAAKPIR